MKDMPTISPENLEIKAMLPREDAKDAIIIKNKEINNINALPQNAVIATSAMRRKAMLLKYRPDLNIIDIRGNINTRLQKLSKQPIDAIILAVAGLKRINKAQYITQYLDCNIMLPAVGQGALGVQCRVGDINIIDILDKINHQETQICVNAERAFMKYIDGDCNTPMGCYAKINKNNIDISAQILTTNGDQLFSLSKSGKISNATDIAINMADIVKQKAAHILELIQVNKHE